MPPPTPQRLPATSTPAIGYTPQPAPAAPPAAPPSNTLEEAIKAVSAPTPQTGSDSWASTVLAMPPKASDEHPEFIALAKELYDIVGSINLSLARDYDGRYVENHTLIRAPLFNIYHLRQDHRAGKVQASVAGLVQFIKDNPLSGCDSSALESCLAKTTDEFWAWVAGKAQGVSNNFGIV